MKNNRAILSWKCGWNHSSQSSPSKRVCSSSHSSNRTSLSLHHLDCFILNFKGPVCMQPVSKCRFFFFSLFKLIDLTLKRRLVTTPPPPPSSSVDAGPCATAFTLAPWDVNKVLFVTFNFAECPFCLTDLSLFLSELVGLFCFLSGDEEGCPFSLHKQTSVWINKLRGLWLCASEKSARCQSLFLPSLCIGQRSAQSSLH